MIVSDWAAGFMLAVWRRTDARTKILLTGMRKVLAPILVSHLFSIRMRSGSISALKNTA